jgi:hypothetical protein
MASAEVGYMFTNSCGSSENRKLKKGGSEKKKSARPQLYVVFRAVGLARAV